MDDVKTRIETAKAKIANAEKARTVAETNLQNAEQQQSEVVKQMAEQGVAPETIAAEIEKLEVEIETGLQQVESLIPEV